MSPYTVPENVIGLSLTKPVVLNTVKILDDIAKTDVVTAL